MKRSLRVVTFLALTLILSGSFQVAAAIDIGVMGTYWDPKDGNESWGVGGKVGIPVITEHLHVELRGYSYADAEDQLGGDLDVIPVDLGVAFHFLPGGKTDLYLMGGVSYVWVDSDRFDIDDETGYYAGGGLNYFLTDKLYIIGEIMQRMVEFEVDRSFSSEEFDATGLTVNAGLGFRF